jgi:phosphatidylserine synthase
MATPVRARRPLLPSLILGAVVVGAVALLGWLLLLFVKGTVVLISYAVGAALIVLPLLLAHRVLAGHTGSERWHRVGTLAEAVGLGVALVVIAHLVGDHGWLLVAIPAAVVAALRVVHVISTRRQQHRAAVTTP